MKNLKNKTLILVLMIFSTTLSAQYQSIFGSQQTSWFMHSWGVTPESIECIPDSMWVVYGQDTTFQNKVFKPLYKQNSYQQSPNLSGFVGEDTTTGEVWFKSTGFDTSVYKMMNMSLTVNDTFYFGYGSLGNVQAAVDSVYYLNSRKVIELDYEEEIIANNGRKMVSYTMIESVGVNIRGVNFNQGNSILINHWKDGNLNYTAPSDSVFYCDTLTSLLERKNERIDFDVFPNPVRETANLSLKELNAEKIQLIDISGRVIKSFSTKEKELNFSDVSNGVYFIRVTTTKQEQITQKVVVQK
jgi:hypothetical protein